MGSAFQWAALGAVVVVGSGLRAQDSPAQRQPNIVFVFADDLGYAELGCYGQAKILTPHIDRLASEGTRFTRFYSASTVCAPSRGSLMTGLHTGHGTIRGNKEVGGWGPEEPEGQWPLPDEEITLAERLSDLGYATAAFGKWGLGGPGSVGHPSDQGFDHFYGYLCQRVAHNYYPTHLWRNHDVDVLHGNDYFRAHKRIDAPFDDPAQYAVRYAGDDYAPEAMIQEAEAWIARRAETEPERPFFLYFPSPIPHAALQVPEPWVEMYPEDWDPEHYLGNRGYLPHPRPRAAYAGMISYFDDTVGRLVAALERSGDLDETIIVVTSDNGTTFNGGVDREFFDSLGGLNGFKTNLYEGGIRVPCVVWWPGVVPAGSTIDGPAHMTDWVPTLVSLAGGEVKAEIDGMDLSSTLAGREPAPQRPVLYWEFPEGRTQQAVLLDGRWKAIRPDLKNDGLRLELYDLESDPVEATDVSAENPEIVARAERAMADEHTPSELFPIPALDSGSED